MGVRIIVSGSKGLQEAFKQLKDQVRHKCRRAWYKGRLGYYEKRGELRRRKELLRQRNVKSLEHGQSPVKMYMNLKQLHQREGGFP